jgi:hypothetical protein
MMIGIAFLGVVAVALLILALVLGPVFLDDWRNRRLLETGLPAKASLQSVRQTERRRAGNPEVMLSLMVEPEAGEKFASQARFYVSHVDLLKLRPGAILSVRYDPADRTRVAVVP